MSHRCTAPTPLPFVEVQRHTHDCQSIPKDTAPTLWGLTCHRPMTLILYPKSSVLFLTLTNRVIMSIGL